MFRSKTVLIVGAGASYEAGFPVGSELKGEIASLVDIRFPDGYFQSSGDYGITEALKKIANFSGQRGDINAYLHAGWHIRNALPQALSIDNFLDSQRDDRVSLMGKLGILQAIIKREKSSKLYVNNDTPTKSIDFYGIADTWYHYFFQLLSEGINKTEVENIFANISIICFNYDRSIEHFLFHALQNYFGIDHSLAKNIMGSLDICHPYGTTGRLPWQDGDGIAVEYGSSRGHDLAALSSSIKTFTEQIDDPDFLRRIKSIILSAEHLVFVGFGFHEMNMQLITPIKVPKVRRVFATAYGISQSDCREVSKAIGILCFGDNSSWDWEEDFLELHNSLKASDLFRDFGRSLRA